MQDPTTTPLSTLKKRYLDEGRPMPRAVAAALAEDPRSGAAQLLAAIDKRKRARRAEGQRLRHLRRFEEAKHKQGYARIAGVDEAGMSPLAGPVVAGAVILPDGFHEHGVNDSKQVTPERREALAEIIREAAVAWGIGTVEPEEIDRINIYHAGLLAMRRAVEALQPAPDYLLVDARTVPGVRIPQEGIIKGDTKSLSIAAASILAKVARDRLMVEFDERYPGYGLAQHKGYPVRSHVLAIQKLGVLPIHRRSFRPVQDAMRERGEVGAAPQQQSLFGDGG